METGDLICGNCKSKQNTRKTELTNQSFNLRMSLKKINGYTLNLNKQLGRGNFGVVYEAEQEGTKIPCAVKMLDKMHIDSDDYIRSAIFREIQILKNLRCQHIVGFYDVMESSRYYYIVQELCDTDLQRLMKKKEKFSEEQSLKYLTQICDGFLCLIKQGIVHRDLKPANIMMRNNQIKLGDFGLAKRCRNKRIKIDSSVGSPLYMSLQLLKQQPYSSKCDIWAVGCVFYQMIHGKTPWHARTQYALVTAIQNQSLKINQSLSSNTKDFINKCLQKKQADRISWDQLFVHPIFNGRFLKYAQRNKQFENKLKMIISDIRFKINTQNIDLRNLFDSLGFNDKTELLFKNFDEFIRIVNPSITTEEVVYFFQKLDENDDGKISIKELQIQMQNNHIALQNKQKQVLIDITPQNVKFSSYVDTQSFCRSKTLHKTRLHDQLEFKIRKCFVKLYKILNDKKLTLYKTFKAYDQKKQNCLSINDFQKILNKLDSTLAQKEIKHLFDFIDKDDSGTIQFDQLNGYYCKVNGVPQIMDLPPEHYYAKGKINYRQTEPGYYVMSHYFKDYNRA